MPRQGGHVGGGGGGHFGGGGGGGRGIRHDFHNREFGRRRSGPVIVGGGFARPSVVIDAGLPIGGGGVVYDDGVYDGGGGGVIADGGYYAPVRHVNTNALVFIITFSVIIIILLIIFA